MALCSRQIIISSLVCQADGVLEACREAAFAYYNSARFGGWFAVGGEMLAGPKIIATDSLLGGLLRYHLPRRYSPTRKIRLRHGLGRGWVVRTNAVCVCVSCLVWISISCFDKQTESEMKRRVTFFGCYLFSLLRGIIALNRVILPKEIEIDSPHAWGGKSVLRDKSEPAGDSDSVGNSCSR